MKTYPVVRTQDTIDINGRGDHPAWQSATLLTDFYDPWEKKAPQNTSFKALHNDQYLYFLFEVETPNFFSIQSRNVQMEVAYSDRVELFFRQDEQMEPYYCLEMDYLGRLLANSAVPYRQMDYEWSWPTGFQFIAYTEENFYAVEGKLSKDSLRQLKLLQNDRIQTGIFQAEYFKRSAEASEMSTWWYAWVQPNTQAPDFHVPSAFGVLELQD